MDSGSENNPIRLPLTIDALLRIVPRHVGVTADEVCSPSRRAPVVLARDLIVFFARKYTSLSFPEIAGGLGWRSHPAAIEAKQRTERRLLDGASVQLPNRRDRVLLRDLIEELKERIEELYGGNEPCQG